MKHVDYEGTRRVISTVQPHEETLYVQQDSHEFEGQLAAQNARLAALGQTGKGDIRLHLQMSEQDYAELLRGYPVLQTGNSRQRRTAWLKIAKARPELVAMEFQPRVHPVSGGGNHVR